MRQLSRILLFPGMRYRVLWWVGTSVLDELQVVTSQKTEIFMVSAERTINARLLPRWKSTDEDLSNLIEGVLRRILLY
jgi:hypothetical protein